MLTPEFKKKEMDVRLEPLEGILEIPGEDEEDWSEDGEEYEDEIDQILQRVYDWGAEWSKTPAFEALTQEQKEESEFIVQSFSEYMYNYHDVEPEEWNVSDMERCCLETLPTKVSSEGTYFRCLSPVLASFFAFLGDTVQVKNAYKMSKRIVAIDKDIVAASNNPRNWGIAKSMVMSAIQGGVDVEDSEAMGAFMGSYTAQLMNDSPSLSSQVYDTPRQETYKREGPKVGRNDACPCGSGKKYKKCCGK